MMSDINKLSEHKCPLCENGLYFVELSRNINTETVPVSPPLYNTRPSKKDVIMNLGTSVNIKLFCKNCNAYININSDRIQGEAYDKIFKNLEDMFEKKQLKEMYR